MQADGVTLSMAAVTLQGAGGASTVMQGRIDQPLEIFARFDSVQICQGGEERLLLGGLSARLVSELVTLGGPVPWSVLAGELWSIEDRHRLRRNLDQVLYRLRAKLESAQVRTTLVQSVGNGHIELSLRPDDRAHDLT